MRRRLVDDLGADRRVEGENDPLDRPRVDPVEPLDLEDRGFEAHQQPDIGAVGEPLGPRPGAGPFGAEEDRRQAFRQRTGASGDLGRHQSEAAERRPAHELGAGDEHDRAAVEIVGDRGRGDPRLARVDDNRDIVAMSPKQGVDVGERGQDQPGLGAVDDVDERVAADCPAGGDRLLHPGRDLRRSPHPSFAVAHRDVGEVDQHAVEPGHRLARLRGMAERGRLGEIAAARGMDAAAADLVGAEQDVVCAARGQAGHASERDIFEVGARRREHNIGGRGQAVGPPDAAAQRLEAGLIDGRRRLGPQRCEPGGDVGVGLRRDVVGGGGGVSEQIGRPRRAVVAVEAGGGVEQDAAVAARGHDRGGIGDGRGNALLNANGHESCTGPLTPLTRALSPTGAVA